LLVHINVARWQHCTYPLLVVTILFARCHANADYRTILVQIDAAREQHIPDGKLIVFVVTTLSARCHANAVYDKITVRLNAAR